MIENLRPEHITATLSRKLMTSSPWRVLIIILYVLSGVSAIGLIDVALTLFDFDGDTTVTMICFGAEFVILLIFTVCLHHHYRLCKKSVVQWLGDAVLIKAKGVAVDDRVVRSGRSGMNKHRVVVIEVTFKYDDKTIVRRSATRKGKPLFSEAYTKQLGRTTIAYSPKYDEVMFISPLILERMENSLTI